MFRVVICEIVFGPLSITSVGMGREITLALEIIPSAYESLQTTSWRTAKQAGRENLGVRGIKAKIGFNVALLLLLSAIITDVLVVVVVQRVMMRYEISRSEQYLKNIGDLFFADYLSTQPNYNPKQALATTLIISQDSIQPVYILDSELNLLYRQNSKQYPFDMIKGYIDSAHLKRQPRVEELGYIWALFWWHPGAISISIPIIDQDQLEGVISAVVPLSPIYKTLRKYHKPIFIYIIINTVVLAIVGFYRIFKLYLSPIDRIVMQADDFHEDEDLFFAFRQEDNELNRLSFALNRMLERISSDKKKLQTTVSSLEQANIELKNAQIEIIRAEKLASVGRLAAGIAHEIGNPIGIVLGYLEMLKQDGLDEEDKIDFLRRTDEEVQRINTVIRQLLDLARPKNATNEHVNVGIVIQDIVDVLQLQPVMQNIVINLCLEALNDLVKGNDEQLRQVFLNLLLNAADAIHGCTTCEHGEIKVRTSMVEVKGGPKNAMLQIQIQDNGAGIEPEKLLNIFDPFYSTKEPGKGTGLGLAVSYMIIEGMGGAIYASNPPENGALFNIELPLVSNDFAHKPPLS